MSRYLATRVDFCAAPKERVENATAVSEVIHDVLELACVRETNGVAKLVNACQVDDRVTEQDVLNGAAGQWLALDGDLRDHVNNRSRFSVPPAAPGFAVEAFVWLNPYPPEKRR